MKRHDLDLVSLIAGTVFLLVAVSHLVGAATNESVDLGWLVPAAMVGLGVAGLAGAVRGRPESEPAAREESPPAEL